MRTFSQQQKAHQQTTSVKSAQPAAHLGQSRDLFSSLQRTIGNQSGQRPLEANSEDANFSSTEPARFNYDFSRIPIHSLPPAAGSIQAKLAINKPGDSYEQEADRIADHVMRMAEPTLIGPAPAAIQRTCAECQQEEMKKARSFGAQSVEGQEEEYPPVSQAVIFRKAEFTVPHTTVESPPALADRLVAHQGGGEPLPAVTRHRMENAFGYDFSRVRIHRDAEAGEMSRQISAHAFTHGSHIYFGNGMYDAEGSSVSHLLAHELTHVVQQGQASLQQIDEAATPAVAVQSSGPVIQRVATWGAGAVHQVNNLASAVLNGTAVGVTWPKLNGAVFWSTADARAAMHRPTLNFAAVAGGADAGAGGGVDATVSTVPTNTGSFDETVLAAGPWTMNTTKAAVGAMLPTLAMCTGAGNSTFRAKGDPSDAAMFAANRRHEDHHAADHRTAFNGSLVPWDTRLTAAKTAGTTYHGATNAAAEAALYAAMGGTPDQVADAFMNACAAAVVAYHGTAAGGPVGAPTDPTANANCSTSSAKYTNPS